MRARRGLSVGRRAAGARLSASPRARPPALWWLQQSEAGLHWAEKQEGTGLCHRGGGGAPRQEEPLQARFGRAGFRETPKWPRGRDHLSESGRWRAPAPDGRVVHASPPGFPEPLAVNSEGVPRFPPSRCGSPLSLGQARGLSRGQAHKPTGQTNAAGLTRPGAKGA